MPGSEPMVRKDSLMFEKLCASLLARGHAVRFRANGQSMRPNVLDGDDVVIVPATCEMRLGDVVMTHGQNGLKVHRVVQLTRETGEVITRGDSGQENDTPAFQVLGKVVAAERHGKQRRTAGKLPLIRDYCHRRLHQLRLAVTRRAKRFRQASAFFLPVFLLLALMSAAPAAAQTQTLSITNTTTSTYVVPGNTVTYTQVLKNTSAVTATNVRVTQTLPGGWTLNSVTPSPAGTWNCTGNPCTDASYAAGSTTTFTVVVTVPTGGTTGTLETESVVARDGNFTGSAVTASVTLAADLSIQQVAPAPASQVAPDTTYNLLQTVKNNTNDTVATGTITVTLPLPSGTSYQTGTGTNWACVYSAVTTTVTCTYNTTLNSAATSQTLTITLLVTPNTASGTGLTNTLTAGDTGFTDPNLTNNTLTVSQTVQAPDLALTESASPSQVAPDTTFTDSYVVTNNGPTNAVSGKIIVTTAAPTSTSYQSFAGTNWTCSGTTTVTCTYNAALNSGATASTLTLTFLVNPGTPSGTITDSATVADSDFTDSNPTNNNANASVTVAAPDLAITETVDPTDVAAGSNFVYSEVVNNNGPTNAAAGTVTLSTTTPANTTYQSYAGTNWTCTTPAAGGTGAINCTYSGALNNGATANTLTITLQVVAGTATGTVITNSATVADSAFTDPTPSNNTSSATVTVQPAGTADLQLLQTAPAPAVAAGSNIVYTETVMDDGPTAATTGTITVYMQTPANTSYQSYAGTNWNCTNPGAGNAGPVICTYNAALASGAAANALTVTFQVAAGTAAGTTIQASASVTNSTLVDPVPTNNTSITSVVVEPTTTSDLGVALSVYPTPVFVSSTLTYTVTVQNLGQASAPVSSNVLLDTLPSGTVNGTFVGVTFASINVPTGWSCTTPAVGASGNVQCSITTAMPAAPAAGSTVTFSITVNAPTVATTLTNTATVSLAGDPNPANNTAVSYTVVQPLACATPGRDGALSAPSSSAIVNTYFPGSGNAPVSSNSLTLGAAAGSPAAQTPIAAGDLLLIIQMQDASINTTNTSSYGDGLPGDPGSGSTTAGSSGLFEYITATNAVPLTGGTLSFTGTGPTGGLLNSYYQSAATSTAGQQTYQIIRVPQYTSATFNSNLTALAWNGSVGGVFAVDVSSQLTLGGTIALDSLGFRGGGGITLAGTTGLADTDYVTASPANLPALSATQLDPPAGSGSNASKGEGIAGTPHWLAPLLSTVTTSSTAVSSGQSFVEGLPGGSFARGGPGNAGGGGTDGDPAGNDYNSGGGAGGNGGSGGQGGYGWNSMAATNSTDGGFGGVPFPASTSALVMGGGGGAGTTNNGTYYISNTNNGHDCGANCTGVFSSGGAGGGIAIIHAGNVVGTGTITANGASTLSTLNDSTGGGGAGGSILVFANSGNLSGLTVSAVGGSAGSAWLITAPGGFPGQRHGPGGGGGGGVVLLSAAPASSNVSGGANGYTDTVQDSYGATPGQPGFVDTTHVITETPGTQSGAYCGSADLSVTNAASPTIVLAGGTITYTQTAANAGPLDAVNSVFAESVPGSTTFQSITHPAGWNCVTPAVGATGTITCSNSDFAANSSGTFTVVVQVAATAAFGTQIVDVDNITSGTSDPNLANNSATAISTVAIAAQADLAVTNTPSGATVTAGSTFTMTSVVSNYGPASVSGAVFTENTANDSTNTYFAAFVSYTAPAGWSCGGPVGAAGTITCYSPTLNAGSSATLVFTENAPSTAPAGTILSGTANINSGVSDPNYGNNSATASIEVATSGQADLSVSGSALPNPVTAGNNITYTQSITNNGPTAIAISGSTTVTFTDAIPANTVLASTFVPPAGWSCNTIAVGATGTFTCNLNANQTLAVGAIVNFPLVVKVNAGTVQGTTITNSPNISSSVSDPNLANNTAAITTTVASPSQAFVTIVKTASPEPVNQGTNLTYTIVVTNNGPAVAQGVTVTDPIPAQVTYASSNSSQGSCSYNAGSTTVTCSLGSLAVGSVATVSINTTATVFGSGAVSCNGQTLTYTSCNTATLTTTTSNPNPTTTSSAASTIQSPTAVDLASFAAFQETGGNVRLVWHTLEESRNLGFNIYRESSTGRTRINSSIIAGSALMLRNSRPQHAAKWYAWVDPQPDANASYWIEDVDINGTRTMHGPAYAEFASSANQLRGAPQPANEIAISPSLNQLRSPAATVAPAMRRPVRTPLPIGPVPAPRSAPPTFNVADHAAVQISVEQEGWYHVPFAQLFAAGLNPNTDVRFLHLYAEGVEQPMLLTGRSAGMPSPTDAIEFYGTGIDTPFSGTRVYWLVAENTFANRIVPAPVSFAAGAPAQSFPFTTLREDRTTYFAALLNGENNDNFFGDVVTSSPVDELLTVTHRDTSSSQPDALVVTLQGATDQQLHSISVQLNGNNVGTFDFYGEVLASQSFSVDPSLLLDGSNSVTLTALNGDNDVSVVQSVQLTYLHTYIADSDWLRATAPTSSEVQLSGFTNPQVRVFDITNPLDILELNGSVSAQSGTYTISAVVPSGSPETRTILAFSTDALSAPSSLAAYIPSFLENERAGVDIVIITHPDFAAHLAPLVQLRSSQGYKVLQVTTDELFNEFNFGERSPFAIRSFLQSAVSQWSRKPKSVLLVGDASVDPRNYLGFGDFDFVPTRIIQTAAFKTSSDDWFSDFQQTGYATIPTGRLPVRTTADLDLLVSKIVGYEHGESAGSWNQQALLIADQNVEANFSAAVTTAAALLPSSLQVSQLLTNGLDQPTAHAQIVNALNNGALLVDYNGHGAEQQWSFSDIFDGNDAAALTNGGRLPVYLLMDCLNGLFQDVYAESLAKSLILAPNGGAVAVWASSGFTEQSPQSSMEMALLHELSVRPNEPIGLMILRAKAATADNDVRRTWIFFGDPAMKLHFGNTPAAALPPPGNPHAAPNPGPIATNPWRGCPRSLACAVENQQ